MLMRCFGFALLALWMAPSTLAQAPVTAFLGGTVIDGTGAPSVENGVVIVRDGRIAAVGPASTVTIPPGATRVELRGRTLLPGFVNAHGHVSDPKDARESLERQLLLYARYGVTSIFSLGEEPGAFPLRDHPARGRARLFQAGEVFNANTAESVWVSGEKLP